MIACLGWGSLVWDPRELPVLNGWFRDGPLVPIEFSRKSKNGRITLAVDERAQPIRVLWTQFAVNDLGAARVALKERESITTADWEPLVPAWTRGEPVPNALAGLASWAEAVGVEAVTWTGLGPKFDGKEARPSVDRVAGYLDTLRGPTRRFAEEYVRRAPAQIDTEYRREIEARLGWTPLPS